jgi:hypothetical protein
MKAYIFALAVFVVAVCGESREKRFLIDVSLQTISFSPYDKANVNHSPHEKSYF